MNADCLTVGLQRVDARFCRGVFGAAGVVATPGALTVNLVKGKKAKSLVYEWGVLVREEPLLIAKAKAEIPAAAVLGLDLASPERNRTRARLTVDGPLRLVCGMQSWDSANTRRRPTDWSPDDAGSSSSAGNAALPPLLRNELLRSKTHEVLFMHSLDKVAREFKQLGIVPGKTRSPPTKLAQVKQDALVEPPALILETPRASRKRPLEASACKSRRAKGADLQDFEGPPPAAKQEDDGREMGSNGEQCDWCGMSPGEGEQALKVCGRCHYSCCTECSPHPAKGTCYCRDSNFGEPYPRGAARKRHMTGSW